MTQTTNKADGNPIQFAQLKVKHLDKNVKLWLQKQPAAVEVAVVTAGTAVQGGAIADWCADGHFQCRCGFHHAHSSARAYPEATASLQQAKIRLNRRLQL